MSTSKDRPIPPRGGTAAEAHEVLVVGAGPAGATAAAVLAAAGRDVLAVDRAVFPRAKPCAEYMSPEISVILDRLGLTEEVLSQRRALLRGFRIVPPGGGAFLADFAGCRRPGAASVHRVGLAQDRSTFDHLLVRHARARGAEVREGFHVEDVLPAEAHGLVGVRGRGPDGERQVLRARAVVAADGLHSVVARRLGLMEPRRRGPRKIALVAHMAGLTGLDDYGEMHVLRDGSYCGIAPLGDGIANVAAVVDVRESPRLKGRRAAYFLEHLTRYPALVGRLEGAEIARAVLAIGPLAWRARRYVAGQVLLAGDATGFYDPFTGEGIYRAMRAAELAAATVDAALREDTTAGLVRALRGYERRHRREFAGKRLVEVVIHEIISRPWLFDHVAARLNRRKALADTLVGVTGDFIQPWAVLNPAYLARLVL